MLKLIFVTIIATLGFATLARAEETQKTQVATHSSCKERCIFEKDGVDTGLKPAIKSEVCFVVALESGGRDVTLTMYDRFDGLKSPKSHVLRQIKHTKPKGESTSFCVGVKDYVSKTVWVDACDGGEPHSDRGMPSLTAGLKTGRVDMCLRGKDCPRYVAEAQ